MNRLLSAFLIVLLLVSCKDERGDVRKIEQVFGQTTYDIEIIKSLPVYDALKKIIILNLDTILQFRNDRHFVFHYYENGDTATVQEDADYYSFYYNYGGSTSMSYGTDSNNQQLASLVSLKNMPAFIYPSIDCIFKTLGKDKIRGFVLWKNGTIEISTKSFSTENVDVIHGLTWRKDSATNGFEFCRDTMIAPRWTYGFCVSEHQER